MNIIIVGCGKVGYTLVEQLGGENHDITVIDEKENKVHSITDELDAMGIIGNGVSYQTLQEAGIEKAHLLIAVTGSDEQNLLCCALAKRAKCQTIARVRNPVYSRDIDFLRKELGVTMIINPEMASAMEISRNFQFPTAVEVDTFSKGRIEMLHFRVTKDCRLKEYKLIHIRTTLKCEVLVCMVKRGEEVIIPRGADFDFREGDKVAIVASHKAANDFFRKIGIGSSSVHTAMIVGGGTIAFYLARRLLSVGISTKIIERDPDRCEFLSEMLPKATVICGDGTNENLLLEEGLDKVEGFAALTGLDEENILLSLYAKKASRAKVVTKVNRINFSGVLNDLNLDSISYPRLLTAETIIKYARSLNNASLDSNVENLYKLEDGKAEALEFYIKEESAVTGIPLAKLPVRKNILICSIARGNQLIIPGGQDELRVGDSVVVVLTNARLHNIKDILEG